MTKKKQECAASDYAQLLFPPGWLNFLGAFISMVPALVLMWVPASDLFLPDHDVAISTSIILGGLVLLATTLSHPTFMLTRGKRRSRLFLRQYNLICIFLLVLAVAVQFFQGNDLQLYANLIGLFFALIAFKLYRSKGFARFCEHFCILWDAHSQRLKSGRETQ